MNHFRKALVFLLCFEFAFMPALQTAAQTRPSTAPAEFDFNLTELQERDPLIKDFAQAPWAPPAIGKFDAKDPILDQDPYFMRSQSFEKAFAGETDGASVFLVEDNAIKIQTSGASRALKINVPLKPLFEGETFLFFQAKDAKLFREKTTTEEDSGEGIFFVDKRDLLTEVRKPGGQRPIPVMFLPLPGLGWTEKISNVLIDPANVLALRNAKGDSVTIDTSTIYKLSQVYHFNVILATIMTLKHDRSANLAMRAKWLAKGGGAIELPYVDLPRGSTAAFGAFFTGYNLDNPAAAIDRPAGLSTSNFSFLPQAHADLFTPDTIERLLFIGKLSGGVYASTLFAQYIVMRDRILERRAFIESQQDIIRKAKNLPPADRTGTGFKIKREFLESIDAFAQGLGIAAAGVGTATGFGMEYLADRTMGHAGRNGWVRYCLSKTYLYGRKQNENIGANWQSFYLGVMILGSIDTAGVVAQLMYVSPVFFPYVAQAFGPEIQSRVEHQFSGDNLVNNNILTSEVMRNFTGYFVSGSYQYASSQRQALMEIVRPEVENQLRQEGKDPSDPQHESTLNKRVETRLNLMLVERGLPSQKEFIFSAPSALRAVSRWMGYKVDRAKLYTSKDYVSRADREFDTPEEKAAFMQKREAYIKITSSYDKLVEEAGQFPENRREYERMKKNADTVKANLLKTLEADDDDTEFALEKARWGMLNHVLKRTVNAAMEMAAQNPGEPLYQNGVKLAQDLKRKYNVIYNILRNPFQTGKALEDAKKVRQLFALLSYEGNVIGEEVKYLDLWKEGSDDPAALKYVARMFRQSLFSTIEDRPGYIKPTKEDLAKYGEQSRKEARELIGAAPREVGFDGSDVDILTLEIVKKKTLAAAAQARADEWKPKDQWLEKHQADRAHREALLAVQTKHNEQKVAVDPQAEMELATGNNAPTSQVLLKNPEVVPTYREAYKKAMAKIVGLYTLEEKASVELKNIPAVVAAIEQAESEFKPDQALEMAIATGNAAMIAQFNPVGDQKARVEELLANNPEALAQYRYYVSAKINPVEHAKELEGQVSVATKATAEAEAEIEKSVNENPSWKSYLAKIDDEAKIRFLAHQFADTFLQKYNEATVSNSKNVSLTSPAQPGIFQKWRQKALPQKNTFLGKFLRTTMRALESPMDTTAYRPGLNNWMRRNIPWYQDAKTDLELTFRIMWTSMTTGYLAQYYIWQVHFTWSQAFFFLWSAGLTTIVHYWLDRLMMNTGVRPMSDTKSKIKYSLLYTWLTYPTYIPFFFFYEDFDKFWSRYVGTPLSNVVSTVYTTCEKLLTGG